jgi:FKBP-type peptidyl-prolyl cis-trans isomerase
MKNAYLSLVVALSFSSTGCKSSKQAPTPKIEQAQKKAAPIAKPGAAAIPTAPADVAAPPANAEKTASGLAHRLLQAGTGSEKPTKWDAVEVHYTGWTTDGKMFDSSVKRGRTAKFGLRQVIPGWTEGMQMMVQGEKRRFWIPSQLAYNNQPGRPQGMLVFDVELVGMTKGPGPIPAPADVAAPPENASKSSSGLAHTVLTQGTGKTKAKLIDRVKVDYTGWTKDGEMFDSSVQRGSPATFAVNGVIKGWTEGLQLMVQGEKRRLWIPAELAYGEKPARPGAPAGQLTFDVELLEIIEAPKPIVAPKDVKAAPKNALKTKSGLKYKVLTAGKGKIKPTKEDKVEVHYTGWSTDGKMFDSSVKRGKPATFGLSSVIKGWTEGLQLMVVGEKTRFWIPGALAYGDTPKRPGAPAGTLVFEIELLKINP